MVGVGSTLGGYHLVELIGVGGMGEIYRAQNVRIDRMVRAIKVIRPELSANDNFRERFLREAEFMELLRHPNILRVEHIDEEEGSLFLVMELLEGSTVDVLVKNGPLPIADAVDIASQGLLGIAHAHANGIIHRDLKPANLFRLDTGLVKVLDFGIARADSMGNLSLTGTSQMTPGSPAYFAPEYADGARATSASDIYAMAITLFQMLTGKLPFSPGGESDTSGVVSLLVQHATKPLPSLRAMRPEIPEGLVEVVAAAAAKRPERRPDALTFAKMLTPFGGREVIAVPSEESGVGSRPMGMRSTQQSAEAVTHDQRQGRIPPIASPPSPVHLSSGKRGHMPSPAVATLAGQDAPARGGGAGRILVAGLVAAVLAVGGWMAFDPPQALRQLLLPGPAATPTLVAVATRPPTPTPTLATPAPTPTPVAVSTHPQRTPTPRRVALANRTLAPIPSTPAPAPTVVPTHPPARSPGVAFLKVTAFPVADVFLDSEAHHIGATPMLKNHEIPSGSHVLILKGHQCDEMKVPFQVAEGAVWSPPIFYLENCQD